MSSASSAQIFSGKENQNNKKRHENTKWGMSSHATFLLHVLLLAMGVLPSLNT